MHKGVIYKYTFPDGKVYIGQTRRNPELRHKQHISPVTGPSNRGFWQNYQKFGSYKYEIIRTFEETNEDVLVNKLNAAESEEIILHKAYDPAYGCNIRIFGTASTDTQILLEQRFSEIIQEILPERLRLYESISTKIFETKEALTTEEKECLIENCMNGSLPFAFPKEFNIDDLSKNDLSDYNEFTFLVSETLDCWRKDICSNTEDEITDFINDNIGFVIEEMLDRKRIVSIDKDGNVVEQFDNFNEIANRFNVPRADNVRNVLNGKQKTAYGYKWCYKRDLQKQTLRINLIPPTPL